MTKFENVKFRIFHFPFHWNGVRSTMFTGETCSNYTNVPHHNCINRVYIYCVCVFLKYQLNVRLFELLAGKNFDMMLVKIKIFVIES